MIKEFTILGERCSGTNFLQHAITRNFGLDITWKYGWKHFFGFNDYAGSDQVLFISIIRHPLDWVNSFFFNPHHLAGSLRGNVHTFLSDPIFSVYESGKGKQGRDMIEDYHIHDKRRYKNIWELRYTKAEFQRTIMPDIVANHIFIKFEDLRDNYHRTLTQISDAFDLKLVSNSAIPIAGYKGGEAPFVKSKKKAFTHIDIINNINPELELEYGYDIMAEWKKINS